MKQGQDPQIRGLNAEEGLPLNPQQFLTPDQLRNSPVVFPDTMGDSQSELMAISDSFIPDMHREPDLPTIQRRQEIKQEIDTSHAKIDLIDERIKADIEAVAKRTETIGSTPKDVLKSLIQKGQYTKDFRLFGHTWTLRALDQIDQMLASEDLKDSSETQASRFYTIAFNHVIFSIEAMDGVSIYQWFPERTLAEFNNKKEEYMLAVRRDLKKYLEVMPPFVIDTLYDKYTEVDLERNKALEELKNL
jgi:hypothetical protein